jgi:hypothetical protein
MSIGNLKDYGNKGNNFPWQLKMLQGIAELIAVSGGSSSSTRTPTITRTSASGTIPGEPISVSISNVGSANGTVNGTTLAVGETINLDAGGLSNKFAAGSIVYNSASTTFLIVYVS